MPTPAWSRHRARIVVGLVGARDGHGLLVALLVDQRPGVLRRAGEEAQAAVGVEVGRDARPAAAVEV